jgi:4-hydroxy-tetrahydrodipicolinate reductase
VRLLLNGRGGKVGRVLAPALEGAGHELVGDLVGAEAVVDFTSPQVGRRNVEAALEAGLPVVIGTSGLDYGRIDAVAVSAGVAAFYAPNFAIGAVLMLRFAAQAAEVLPRAEIVELHNEAKQDAPSGTAAATSELLGGRIPIHSVRLPGLVAHQEVLFGGEGQLLTIRHDAFSREAYVPGVLLALERLPGLPAGLTVGLDALL